ncbi:MAG TPA: MYXO-CTERM sorting domain-containing protein, partial [Myxococcaceae bacterium]|nr:MYXO-CTERM sorting domain-containing protein [Myxococcaceae bacterium]
DGRLVLSTNFGLLVSGDGSRWHWICEGVTGLGTELYRVGADGTVYAASLHSGLRRGGAPDACGWERGGGTLEGASLSDVLPDPSRAERVFAIARPLLPDQSNGALGLYVSSDGGRTFGPPLLEVPANEDLTSMEVAPSDPRTIYVTKTVVGSPVYPALLRSTDGGANWTTVDLRSVLGHRLVRVAAVDAVDPRRLYLRVTDLATTTNPDTLVISDDGGATFRSPKRADGSPLRLGYAMSAFLRRADGSLLIGVSRVQAAHPLYRSTDEGHTFEPVPGAPHVRALAERAGVLYAAADDITDGYAVASSTDGGATWTPLLRFAGICGPLRCGDIPSTCAAEWDDLRITVGIPEDPCGEEPASSKGCGCALGSGDLGAGALLLGLGLWMRRRRRRR